MARCRTDLSPIERANLIAESAYLPRMSARFCADAVRQCYFKEDRTRFPQPGAHNLHRASGQFRLAKSVKEQQSRPIPSSRTHKDPHVHTPTQRRPGAAAALGVTNEVTRRHGRGPLKGRRQLRPLPSTPARRLMYSQTERSTRPPRRSAWAWVSVSGLETKSTTRTPRISPPAH